MLIENWYTVFKKWWRGQIWLKEDGDQKIARKVSIDNSKKWAINKEICILKRLKWVVDFVPQITDSWDWWFEYRFLEGETLKKILKNKPFNQYYHLFEQLLQLAAKLDELWVVHGELWNPLTNIIVSKTNKIYIIDFERWTLYNKRPGRNSRVLREYIKAHFGEMAEWLKAHAWKACMH